MPDTIAGIQHMNALETSYIGWKTGHILVEIDTSQLSSVKALPAYKRVYEVLRARIEDGSFPLGARLPTETELSRILDVNRSTLREGIRLLEEAGIVERKEGRRLYVSAPSATELIERANRTLLMNQISFQQLWEAMMEIEPICARFAAERRTADDLANMHANIEKMRGSGDDMAGIIRLDIEFHELVARSMNNVALALSRQVFSSLLLRANALMMPRVPQSIERMIDSHLSIVEAIQESHIQRAEKLMGRHIADFRRGYSLTGIDFDAPMSKAAGLLHLVQDFGKP